MNSIYNIGKRKSIVDYIPQRNIITKLFLKVLHARSQKRLFVYYAVLVLTLLFFQLFFTTSASGFQIGDRVKATENLNVRNCPFLACNTIGVISAGGTGRIINGSYSGDNYTWWYIGWDNGLTGYSVQNYLTVIPGTFSLSYETPVCDTGSPGPSPAVRLNWTTSKNASYYDVYRNGSLYASSNTGNTFYNSANLVAGQSYTYFIKARNSSGSQNSNTISVSIPSNICDSATIPASFTLNQPSTSCNSTNPQISLSWGSSSGATSYKVYRNGAYYANAYTSLTYNNTSVVSGTTYTYFIRASNSAGYRDSNTVTATAPNCVADPQITIGPSSLSFGSVQTGSCSSASFAIQHVLNTGTASGTVAISQSSPFRVASNSSFSLSNGQAVNVGVEFCPTNSGSFSGTAVISSNAAQNINSVNLSGTGFTPAPTTGVIQVNAKLDGSSWSGSVNYSISGAQNFSGNSVSADFQDRPQGNYTLAYVSGGPANSAFTGVTPSSSQTLNGGGVISFTLNFIEKTTTTTSTTTSTTTTSTTTSPSTSTSTSATTTISSTTSTSTTSTPTSTTSTTTTTLPIPSTITKIEVPDIKWDYLGYFSSENCYKLEIKAETEITISLFSTDFDTHLTLKNNTTGETLEDDDGHIDYGESGGNILGTNSEICVLIAQGTYTIEVTRSSKSGTQGGHYTLVVRDIVSEKYRGIETLCGKRWDKYPAVFPGPWHVTSPNSWEAKWHQIGGDERVGRCGAGGHDGSLDCWNSNRYTRDCFNHDVCVGAYGHRHCVGIFDNCFDDCNPLLYSEDCGPDLNVGKSDSCDYSKIQFAIDAANSGTAIKIQSGIYSEHLTSTPETVILRGGWDDTSSANSSISTSTNSSTSTVNSLTITDGKIIVDNLVIQ